MLVERFVAFSLSACDAERREKIRDIARKFVNSDAGADADAIRIFTLTLDDPCSRVRAEMAAELASCDRLPRTLVWGMAQDLPDVAAPVVEFSPLLREADLIHIAKEGDCLLREALARRERLSADIARTLAERGESRAVATLLENRSVELSSRLKHEIASRLGCEPEVRVALLRDAEIEPSTRQMLVMQLSERLFSMVDENEWCGSERIRHAANDSANRVTVDIAMSAERTQMADYVRHLIATSQMTAALLLRSICAGNAVFFEQSLAELANVSLKRVQSIIDTNRDAAFSSLYSATGLPENARAIFLSALSVWRELGAYDLDEEVSEAALNSVAIDAIIERVEHTAKVDENLMAMLRRLSTEAARDVAREIEPQKLLFAA